LLLDERPGQSNRLSTCHEGAVLLSVSQPACLSSVHTKNGFPLNLTNWEDLVSVSVIFVEGRIFGPKRDEVTEA